jgi:hypothetical protein
VHYNGRLQDVMVLSDSNYIIKVQIPLRSTEQDKFQIVFKRLAGNDDEEPIGKQNLYLSI